MWSLIWSAQKCSIVSISTKIVVLWASQIKIVVLWDLLNQRTFGTKLAWLHKRGLHISSVLSLYIMLYGKRSTIWIWRYQPIYWSLLSFNWSQPSRSFMFWSSVVSQRISCPAKLYRINIHVFLFHQTRCSTNTVVLPQLTSWPK